MEGMEEVEGVVEHRQAEGQQQATYSILVVEDDTVTLKAVEAILRIHGNYKVTTAMSVAQALHHIKDARDKGQPLFDIILTDLCLPEVSGLQLIHDITDIPVVVMSCQDSQASVLQAFEAGAAGYLIKPIRKNEVSTLWQHIWRNNRCKVAPQAGVASATANDSGNSTSTGQAGQNLPQGSSRHCDPGPAQHPGTPPADPLQQHQVESEQSLGDAQPSSSSGSQLGQLSAVVVQPALGADIAAIHFDLPIPNVSELAASARPAALAQTGAAAASPALDGPADDSSSLYNGGAVSSAAAEAEAAELPAGRMAGPTTKGLQPLSRPQASATGGTASGHTQQLPPGLQELATLGQQRQQQEAGPQVPSLWQPHSSKAQLQPQLQPQTTSEPAQQNQCMERAMSGLNHSCGSAFTAVTVFLPRAAPAVAAAAKGSSAAAGGASGAVAEPCAGHQLLAPAPDLIYAPQQRQAASNVAAPGFEAAVQQQQAQQLTRAPSASATTACEGQQAMQQPTGALPSAAPHMPTAAGGMWAMPMMACHMPPAAHAQAPALSPMHYLPQSVVQLISALSRRTAEQQAVTGAAGVGSAPTADGSQLSKSSHRQAAVAKYIEKRKNRSFQKKVRYESRKRLAESRPRVKGQFVKQNTAPAVQEQTPDESAAASGEPALFSDGIGKASSESDAPGCKALMLETPATHKRARPYAEEEEEEMESEDHHVSDTEP